MKILICGGCGYIGCGLVDLLLANGHEVTVYDNLLYEDRYLKKVSFIFGDCRDTDKLIKEAVYYDVVVWLCALVGDQVCSNNPVLAYDVNFTAVKNFIDRYTGKFVFTSTCYDESTKCWTTDGLKKYQDINIGDMVMTMNLTSKELEFKPVKKVIVKDYDGCMNVFKSRRVSLSVTDDHKMLIENHHDQIFYENASDTIERSCFKFPIPKYNNETKPSEELLNIDYEDLFYMIGLFVGDGYCSHSIKKIKNISGMNRSEFLKKCKDNKGRFVKAIVEGDQENTICNSYKTCFCLPEEDVSRLRLTSILEKNNIKYYKTKIIIGITSREIHDFFLQFGKYAKNKSLPRWVLSCGKNYLLKMFDGLIHSDGDHSRYKGEGNSAQYYTVSEKLSTHQFPELAYKLGYSYSVYKRYTESFIDGRKISGDSYVCSFTKTQKSHISKNSKKEKYVGKVWCIEVEDNHNLLVERDGKYIICGNCSVYGANDDLLNESSPTNPLSVYAVTKLKAEQHIMATCPDALVFRLGTLYGISGEFARPRLDLVVNYLTMKACKDEEISVFGGDQYRPLLSVKDVARAISNGINLNKSGMYCLSMDNYKIKDIAKEIVDVTGSYSTIRYTDIPFVDARNYRVDTSLANKWFQPMFSLEEEVCELETVFKENRIKDVENPIYNNGRYLKTV